MLTSPFHPSRKLIFHALALAMISGSVSRADLTGTEPVTYVLENFEETTPTFPFYGSITGGALADGYPETHEVHAGHRASRLEWDSSNSKTYVNPWIHSNFMFSFKRSRVLLMGDPQAMTMWVHAEPDQVGVPLTVFVIDATGEFFSTSAKVKSAGWSQVTFDLTAMKPSIASGNHDGKLDLPASFMGLVTGDPGTKGKLLVDDVELTSKGVARDFVETNAVPKFTDFISWGVPCAFRFDVTNHASQPLDKFAAHLVITNPLTGAVAWEKQIEIPELAGGKTQSFELSPEIPNGVYDLKWDTSDVSGALPTPSRPTAPFRLAQMSGDVSALAVGKAQKDYMRKWGIVGGVFWETPYSEATQTGASWERIGAYSQWNELELEPGKLDVTRALNKVRLAHDAGLSLIYNNCTTDGPKFYPFDEEGFAAKYGHVYAKETEAFQDMVKFYEIGNEDNGTAKYIYTEMARNGAAGVRSASFDALTGTTGTASVDTNFMRLQAGRGLFDRLDALVTHPYTWASSPEAYGVEGQFDQIDQIIDDLGGMKIQLTTEFGYSETFDQLKRAQWVPRNYAIGAAAGLFRHGLYAWDNEFGLYYDREIPFPVAASLNTYAFQTYGYRFAGWLQKDNAVWAAVYDKAGQPLVMAWSPNGTGSFQAPLQKEGVAPVVHDLFGNTAKPPASTGDVAKFDLTESPIYIGKLSPSVLATGYNAAINRARARYQHCLGLSDLKDVSVWKVLADGDKSPSADTIRQALLTWQPSATPVPFREQAVVAQALRMLNIATHAEAAMASGEKTAPKGDLRQKWMDALKKSVADDVDIASLRWLLWFWDQTRDEIAAAQEMGNSAYAGQLATLEPVYDKVAAQLAEHGSKLFFPVWPYLHAPAVNGKLVEHLVFTPGTATTVKVRLQSYSTRAYPGEVTIEMPAGWTIDPPTWKGTIAANAAQDVEFKITAGNEMNAKSLVAVLTVPEKPAVRVPFDDFEVLPPLEVRVPILSKIVPGAPLPLELVNNGAVPLGARVRLVEKANTPALARMQVDDIAAGETRKIEMQLPADKLPPAFNEWNLIAEMKTSDGKTFDVPLTLDFDVAARATTPPQIDGDLKDWQDALPNHIDKLAYTRGSYPSGWSKEDESGIVYTKWDDKNFYIAVKVSDQTFNQQLVNGDVWAQDCVQFCLSKDGGKDEFSLAQTPKGPQIWDNSRNHMVTDGQLHVALQPGQAIYEAAIPWSAMPDIKPTAGEEFKFDILLNDDDAIVRRRFLERYGIGIVNTGSIDTFGTLRLGDAAPPATVPPDPKKALVVFHDDFEEYAPDATPDVWTAVSQNQPIPTIVVKAGLGMNGSKCLQLDNTTGAVPYTYLTLTRPLNGLVAGKHYRISAMVKGANATDTSIIGTCLDSYGNAGYNWIPNWKPTDQWQEVSNTFTSAGGPLNVIIRNSTGKFSGLLIDDVKVTEAP